jgi:hypothetical protein
VADYANEDSLPCKTWERNSQSLFPAFIFINDDMNYNEIGWRCVEEFGK